MEKTVNIEKLPSKIMKSKNIGELAEKVSKISDSLIVVGELIKFTYDYCDKIKNENLLIYDQSVKPLLIIVSNCENELRKVDLSEEMKKTIYMTLFQAQKDISIEGEKVRKSKQRELAIAGGALTIGVVAGAIIKTIFNMVKK